MATKKIKQSKARFDTRLSKEQKVFFERAARNLSSKREPIINVVEV